MKRILLVVAVLSCLSTNALAIELDDPVNFQLVQVWAGADFGVPGRLGGLMFSADGTTLFIVGDSEASNSALYALPVIRDATTERVTGFGMASLVFTGDPSIPGLDAGLEIGPGGTLFYTYWSSHHIGERVTTSTVEVTFDMNTTGVPSSVAGLTFSPHVTDPTTGFGQMQVSSWLGDGLYDVPLTPLGGGVYEPGASTLFARLPQQGTGAIQYVPRGRFAGNLMYVNWDFGEVRMLVIDSATGLPIDATTGVPTLGTMNPRDQRFAYDLGQGPWGLEFDSRTFDFFVTTWSGTPGNSIVHFSGPGFANQPPTADSQAVTTLQDQPLAITLTGTDPELDPLTFTVVGGPSNGTLTGTTAQIVYTPNLGFTGLDELYFVADDGTSVSLTATVAIDVSTVLMPDGGVQDAGAPPDSGTIGPNRDGGTAPARDGGTATIRDAGVRDAGDKGSVDATDGEGCDCRDVHGEGRAPRFAVLSIALAFFALRRR